MRLASRVAQNGTWQVPGNDRRGVSIIMYADHGSNDDIGQGSRQLDPALIAQLLKLSLRVIR